MEATRIVVVEDERIVALHLRQQLTQLGYEVVAVAASGEQALQALQSCKPDIVLMDINIEGDIDGIETASRIPPEKIIPVIYLTAYSEDTTLRRAAATNPYGYLLKPFSERELHSTLQMALAHRNTERIARTRERRFRDFAQMASDWFWETDAEHRLSWISIESQVAGRATENYIEGSTRPEIWGSQIPKKQIAEYEENLQARQPFRDFLFIRIMPDGERRHLSINGDPIFSDDGVFTGYRGTGRDVTERIHNEEVLMRSRQQAEAANLAKSAFLASMSHEFRTPLNAILGFSEIIRDEVMGSILPGVYKEYGGYINDSGSHLLSLINGVLDISKMEAGRFDLREEIVNLSSIIKASLNLITNDAAHGRLRLISSVPESIPHIWGDLVRLKQILLNLLSNAIKFTPPGGMVSISVARSPEGGLSISVQDTGIGMDPEKVPIALEAFQRLDDVYTRETQGSGLGLFLAKRLTDLHQGTLEIETALGVGTTVHVHLPKSRVAIEN